MCGIAGVFEHGRTRGGVSEDLLVRMRRTLAHRGPDGEGLFVSPDGRLGLAHRRLSIVDLAGGAQPMHGEGGTCLVFNGEIYNYPQLRRELEADGARFRTDCDTEVILHLYERHGDGVVERLVGMFAFALWDPRRERLLFARDPIGEKPLYWADHDGALVLGSEVKALLEHPSVPRAVNEEAVGPYLANLVSPAPATLYRGIQKLPAGSMGWCDSDGVRVRRYWSPAQPRRFDGGGGDPAARVRELLDSSVRARLMSDVPVGVLLSGGMDSTTIVALLQEQARDMASFTVGFPGYESHDEREEARFVADRFGTDHHEVVLTEEDALGSLGTLVHHADEPLADPVCIPLHAVCRLARANGVPVVLAGEGADELFWGYDGYRGVVERWPRYSAMLRLPRLVRRLAAAATSPTRAPRRREQLDGIAAGRMRPIHMPFGMTGHQRGHVLLGERNGAGWSPTEDAGGEDPLTTLAFDTQEFEFEVRLPELLLMRIDRFSMANGVEARVPFLDPALVDYVYRLPLHHKVRDGVTKHVLKRAVADVVPERVSGRRKQGFSAPTSRWFAERHGGLLKDLMGRDALRAYFDVDQLRRLLDSADPTSWESGQILWPVLNFGLWHRHWIEGEPIEDVVGAAVAA
ncbi:MAG TPA: asparagine synthase (glutamine-hydrolyzing) [Thermoleophilaceae bacterium]|jgi:asparagine synthase (glutamine-hydrolysing)